MQMTIKGVNLEVTPALEARIRQKLEKVNSHLSTITSIDVILKVEKHEHIAEANLLFPKHEIFAKAEDKDMYLAIDTLADRLLTQVNKQKELIKDHH